MQPRSTSCFFLVRGRRRAGHHVGHLHVLDRRTHTQRTRSDVYICELVALGHLAILPQHREGCDRAFQQLTSTNMTHRLPLWEALLIVLMNRCTTLVLCASTWSSQTLTNVHVVNNLHNR